MAETVDNHFVQEIIELVRQLTVDKISSKVKITYEFILAAEKNSGWEVVDRKSQTGQIGDHPILDNE